MCDDEFIEEKTAIDKGNTTNTMSNLTTLSTTTQIPMFLCYSCKTKIPQIRMTQDGNVIKAELKCHYCKQEMTLPLYLFLASSKMTTRTYCQYKFEHRNALAIKYCLNEQKWACQYCVGDIERLNVKSIMCQAKVDFTLKCKVHKKKNKVICKDCHVAVCKLCKEIDSHKNHSFVTVAERNKEYNDTLDFDKKNQLFKQKIDKNTQMKDSLIKLLTVRINELTKLKADLEEVYATHKKNNEQLLEYILQAKLNYETLETLAVPEIVPNVLCNFILNTEELSIDIEKLEQSCSNAIRYFRNNHFVQLPRQTKCVVKENAHSDLITCMISLQDGRIASGSCDGKIKLWKNDNEFKETPQELSGHKQKVLALLHLKKNNYLVSGGSDNTLFIWNLSTEKIIKELKGHTDAVYCLLEMKGTSMLMSSSADETIRFWNFETGALLNSIKEDTSTLLQINDDSIVTTCDYDCSIKIWEPNTTFQLQKTLESHKKEIHSVCQLNNYKLASGSYDEIIIWDLVTYTQIEKVISEDENFAIVYSMIQLSDGTLVIGCLNKVITFDMTTMNFGKTHEGHTDLVTGLVELKDKRIASCSWDKSIRIWNV